MGCVFGAVQINPEWLVLLDKYGYLSCALGKIERKEGKFYLVSLATSTRDKARFSAYPKEITLEGVAIMSYNVRLLDENYN